MTTNTGFRVGSVNRLAGYVFGAVYLLVGMIGFAITTNMTFTSHTGKHLFIFGLNPLHNFVHVLVGIALAGAAGIGVGCSKAVNSLVGAVYLLVGAAGFFLTQSGLNLLAVNHPDNVLHVVSAGLLLAIGVTRQ
ncbi:MAG TPA: DUF4383 domain-containing protein [Amycolatopsis sp.]|uniref:DUF4383 domain-containing protein n=1 Tax=Amycolatopsis sp. TaxID=37632 RepID=UPI002B482658|nr:DUF4383 domain-containing protein [Amycolatopsis sp.]HKS46526.1 DUF4383 domain-containing protein [Amycolatopsis sp.]